MARTIEQLAQEVKNKVYEATVGAYEEAERTDLIIGNGHHMAQKAAEDAATLLMERHAKRHGKQKD